MLQSGVREGGHQIKGEHAGITAEILDFAPVNRHTGANTGSRVILLC